MQDSCQEPPVCEAEPWRIDFKRFGRILTNISSEAFVRAASDVMFAVVLHLR